MAQGLHVRPFFPSLPPHFPSLPSLPSLLLTLPPFPLPFHSVAPPSSPPSPPPPSSVSPVLLVAGPEDLVVARVRDVEDAIAWDIRRGHYQAAIDRALQCRTSIAPHKVYKLLSNYMIKGEKQ